MSVIFVFDDVQENCWNNLASLGVANVKLACFHEWDTLQSASEQTLPPIFVCNLDANGFDATRVLQLHSTSNSTPGTPLLLLSCKQKRLDEFQRMNCSSVELICIENGFDYARYRINYLLELENFARDQHQALQEASNRHQVMVESAAEGIIQYDVAGKIEYVNPYTSNVLGWTSEELLDSSVFDLITFNTKDETNADSMLEEITGNMLQESPFSCGHLLLKTAKASNVVAEMNCNRTVDSEGLVNGHIMMFQDITARTLNEERLIKLAKYDVLTGLSNRSKFHDFTEGKITYCNHHNKKMALLVIDLDHFKNINDTLGHDTGDDLLVAMANRLRTCVRETDLVSRIDGDEFAITLLDVGNPNQVTRIVRHILSVLAEPFELEDRDLVVSVSIGISLFPENATDIKTLVQTADTAVHQAKADGRNTYRFYSADIQNRVMEQTSLEEALRRAIANDEFYIHYQPQVDSISGRIIGLESLIRWQHEDFPNIGPHRFIPVAEECGLLPSIGRWILKTACLQTARWLEDKVIPEDFSLSVNLSPKQLLKGDNFIEMLETVLYQSKLPPQNLVLELTETAVMQDPDVAITTLSRIHETGVKIAVDDFGTGYSSLNYLKKLPLHKLKIDRSFVKDINIDANGEAIVKAILALAHSLNLEVVAEGVEEKEHVAFLREHDCEVLQGYYFSPPIGVDEITEMLQREYLQWETIDSPVGKSTATTDGPGRPDISH